MMLFAVRNDRNTPGSEEQGWALLGLLLALGVMSIVLVSSIVPNVQIQVQREKEAEMLYRGDQMAQAIARYYNRGSLAPIQLVVPPPYGYLTEIEKLRDGVTIGVREMKFVRPSAMIDPLSNSEWEPVKARDPRIMKFLQAWAAETLVPIPTQYLLMAAPPQKSAFAKLSPSNSPGEVQAQPTNPGRPSNSNNPQTRQPPQPRRPQDADDDDDDDDDDVINDPLAHLFSTGGPGLTNAPIIGVAPKKKGKAMNAYYGLDNYEDWIFLFIPKTIQPQLNPGIPVRPGQNRIPPGQNRIPPVSQ